MSLPLITNVHLTTTHRCNLACKYCFVAQEPLDMPWSVAENSIRFLAKNAILSKTSPEICFFGGEPLLRWDDIIVPSVEFINKNFPHIKFKLTITTNCTLLTQDKIDYIKANKIGVLTSVDGGACTQDYNRPFHGGRGSMSVVEPNIKALLAAGMTPTFRSTIIPATCENTFDNYLYAISLGYKGMFATADVYSEWDEEHEKTLEREMYKIADHYIEHWKTHKKHPIRLSLLERHIIQCLRDNAIKAKGGTPSRLVAKASMKCGLGQMRAAAISPTGDIYACQELTSNEGDGSIFYIGNIRDGVDDERRRKIAETHDSAPVVGDMDCNSCEAKTVCNGGCVANNYMISGSLSTLAHGGCFFQRLMTRVALYIIKNLRTVPEFAQSFRGRSPYGSGRDSAKNGQQKNNNGSRACQVCDKCQVCDVCQVKDRA